MIQHIFYVSVTIKIEVIVHFLVYLDKDFKMAVKL